MSFEFRLRLPKSVDPATARRLVKTALTRWEIDERLDDALVVTTELVENVFRHTDNGGRLRLRHRRGAVRIEVSDCSTAPPKLRRDQDRSAQSGFGMCLVDALADRWGFHTAPDGKVVWAELDTPA